MYYDQAFIGWGPVSQANRFYHGREQLIYGIIFFVLICFCCLCPCFYISLYRDNNGSVCTEIGHTRNKVVLFERYDDFQEASKVLKSKDFAPVGSDRPGYAAAQVAEEQRRKDQAAVELSQNIINNYRLDHADSEFVAVEMVNFTDLHSTSVVQEVE